MNNRAERASAPSRDRWDKVPPALRDRIEDGERAIERIDRSETFFDWLRVGDALDDLQAAALQLAGAINKPTGRGYNAAYEELSKHCPRLAAIDKSTRSQAVWMARNRALIEPWRAALPTNKRREVNHPRTVRRLFERDHPPAKTDAGPEAPAKAAQVSELRTAIDELREVTNGIERDTAPLQFDMTPDLIADSAQNFVEIYGAEATGRFIAALLPILDGKLALESVRGFLQASKPIRLRRRAPGAGSEISK